MKKVYLIIFLTIALLVMYFLMNTEKIENLVLDMEMQVLGVVDNSAEIKPKKTLTQRNKKIFFETQKLYSLINSYRKENKLSSLQIDKSLEISAKRKVADMIESNYFRHEDENNLESWFMFKIAGYEYKTAGENLSSGANSPWKVFDAWKNSELHNKQLLNKNYDDMGISSDCESYIIAKKPSCVVVLHLGSK